MKLALPVLLLVVGSTGMTARQQPSPVPPPDATAPAASGTPQTGRGGRGGRGGSPRVIHIPDAPALNVTVVEQPLQLPDGMTWGVVASVAVNSKGHVFVYQRTPAPLAEFDAQGRFVQNFPTITATRAHSMRIDAEDNLWLVDSGDHTVTKRNPRGDLLMTLGTKDVVGTGDADAALSRFNIPSDVAIARNGDIFIAQGEAGGPDPRIIRFDSAGKFIATWSLAYAEGPRANPHAIEIGSDGLLYVADRNVMRIRVFQPDGTAVREIQLQNQMCGLFADRQHQLWAATCMDGQVLKLDWNGRILGFTGRRGTGAGEYSEAHMLAVGPNGDIYVADSVGRKVERLVPR